MANRPVFNRAGIGNASGHFLEIRIIKDRGFK
jgi:hypothetical protein